MQIVNTICFLYFTNPFYMDNLDTVLPEALETDNPLIEIPDPVAKRHAEQLAGSRAEVTRLENLAIDMYSTQSTKDQSVFLELHSKDPKLADKVAKNLWYSSADEVLSSIKKPEVNQWFTEADIERIVSEREAKKEHQRAITKAEKILEKLPDDLKEEAQAKFDRISTGQLLDEETAIEFAHMATLYVNRDNFKAWILNDSLAMLGSTWVWKSKKVTIEEPQYVVRNGKLVLTSNN